MTLSVTVLPTGRLSLEFEACKMLFLPIVGRLSLYPYFLKNIAGKKSLYKFLQGPYGE
jgi:hypothetical protein